MTMDGLNVLDKEAKDFPKLGVELQSVDSSTAPYHDNDGNQHRPFPSSENWVGDGDGPTGNDRPITNDAYHVVAACSGAAAAVTTSAGTIVRAVQPFDISPTTPLQTASKFPGRMATTTSLGLGFPFTNAQWKELERQAMIYKYMMAAVPVPPELLIPTSRTSSDPAASHAPLGSSGLKLRLSSSTDPEPGRCKRTDGKKWRCSRDVAPDHKYCERHLHRGRPRSRKPVEVHASNDNIKRSRREDYQALPTPSGSVAIANPTINTSGFSSQFLGPTTCQPYHQPTVVSVASHKEPRSLDWMLKGEPVPMDTTVQQWYNMMQTKMEFTYGSSFCNANDSAFKQNYSEDPLNMNSYAYFSTCEDPRNKDCCLFVNPDVVSNQEHNTGTTRGFIDAWSNAVTEENIANSSAMCSVSSDGLSPSSLTLSMGGRNSIDEEMGQIHMGLGQIERDQNIESGSKSHLSSWLTPASSVAPAPGGPLAEVLRPSTVSTATGAASEPSTPITGKGDSSSSLAIMVSSPSGVLQKTFASFSDSSGNSSPNLGSSRANPEIALPWLN